MSGSEPMATIGAGASGAARLELASPNTMLEITVVGPDFRPVANGVGSLEAEVVPGIYQIVTRAGPSVERQLVSLAAGETHSVRDLWVSFPSAAPVAGTTTTHEYHEELAREVTRRAQRATTASWLAVVVRDVRGRDGPPLEISSLARLSVLDRGMRPVPDASDAWELRDRDAVAAWSGGLPPGPYLLRTEAADGTIDQAIWLSPGWQTVVFLTVGPAGPEPASASVHMVDMALEWSPDADRAAEAAELASWALREERSVVPADLLDLLLNSKFRNPMYGLIGAHALMLQPSVDEAYLDTVFTNLGSLVPGHPDLVALRWIAEERRARDSGRAAVVSDGAGDIDWPPMLLVSYQALLRMDAEDPGALRDGSVAERIAANLTVEGIWTAWRPVPPDVEEPTAGAPPAAQPEAAAAPPVATPRGPGVDGAAWQPELETGEVLPGLAPSIETLARRRYRDPATARVARYLATVAQLEGPTWAGARFAEISTAELARATQLPTATVDRSVRELRLLTTTLPPPPDGADPRQPDPRPRPDDGGGGGGIPRLPLAFLVAIALLLLVGLGAVVGMVVFDADETPSPSPSASPTTSPTEEPSPSPTGAVTSPPTPIQIGLAIVDPRELWFGEVVIGFDSFFRVTVANQGLGTLHVEPSTIGGDAAADYLAEDRCAGVDLAPGGSCTIGVRFAPLDFEERLAELVVTATGQEPIVVLLAGVGLPESPPFIDPFAWDFVNGPVNVVVIATGPIVITDVTIEGEFAGAYAVNEEACEVALAAAELGCSVTVEFIGDFVSCDTVQPAELVFYTAGGGRYTVALQNTVIC